MFLPLQALENLGLAQCIEQNTVTVVKRIHLAFFDRNESRVVHYFIVSNHGVPVVVREDCLERIEDSDGLLFLI